MLHSTILYIVLSLLLRFPPGLNQQASTGLMERDQIASLWSHGREENCWSGMPLVPTLSLHRTPPMRLVIINFPYSTCIRSFFGSSILTSLFIFKCFFGLVSVIFLQYIANVTHRTFEMVQKNRDPANIKIINFNNVRN